MYRSFVFLKFNSNYSFLDFTSIKLEQHFILDLAEESSVFFWLKNFS